MSLKWTQTGFLKTDIMTSNWTNCLITWLHLIFGSENVPAETFLGKESLDCVYHTCLNVTALQITRQQYYGCVFIIRKWIYLNTATESMDYPVIPTYDQTLSTSTCNTYICPLTCQEVLHMTETRNLVLPQFESCIMWLYMRKFMVCNKIQMQVV